MANAIDHKFRFVDIIISVLICTIAMARGIQLLDSDTLFIIHHGEMKIDHDYYSSLMPKIRTAEKFRFPKQPKNKYIISGPYIYACFWYEAFISGWNRRNWPVVVCWANGIRQAFKVVVYGPHTQTEQNKNKLIWCCLNECHKCNNGCLTHLGNRKTAHSHTHRLRLPVVLLWLSFFL